MIVVASLLGLSYAAGLLWTGLTAAVMLAGPAAIDKEPVAGRHRAPLMGQPAAPLPKRPEGRAALKAEIAASTSDNLPVLADRPVGASGKRHDPDWRFRTDEWEIARASFFEGQPQDQAITRPWAGVGR